MDVTCTHCGHVNDMREQLTDNNGAPDGTCEECDAPLS